MCNLYSNKVAPDAVIAALEQLRIPLDFPEGVPNFEPRDEIRITDRAPILRWRGPAGEGIAELVQRRWSWPGPGGKPVYNFRSDGREFGSGRCLIVADGFYEWMKAEDPKQPRQPWRFTVDGGEPFAFAGLCTRKEWGDEEDRGFDEGWLYSCTIVTTTPNEVVAKVHDRMPAILPSAEAEAAWLRPDLDTEDAIAMCAPLPASRVEGAPANPKLNKVGKGAEGPELLVAP